MTSLFSVGQVRSLWVSGESVPPRFYGHLHGPKGSPNGMDQVCPKTGRSQLGGLPNHLADLDGYGFTWLIVIIH